MRGALYPLDERDDELDEVERVVVLASAKGEPRIEKAKATSRRPRARRERLIMVTNILASGQRLPVGMSLAQRHG